jgi:hypothetical protein
MLSFDEDKIAISEALTKLVSNYLWKILLILTGANNVYLHDKITNEYFDIKNSFHEVVLPAGTNNSIWINL